jgi:hypothetical protein
MPPNSEVSNEFLKICAESPIAMKEVVHALALDGEGRYQKVEYSQLASSVRISDLVRSPFPKIKIRHQTRAN